MQQSPSRKRKLLMLWLLALGLLISGCATVPPQPITGAMPTLEPTEVPVDIAPDTQDDATLDEISPFSAEPQLQTATPRPANPSVEPTLIELYYSGMPSMMGFADASQATIYENVMDALPATATLCWPSATMAYFRYGQDIPKTDMSMTKEQLLAQIGNPSFYRDTAMTTQPERLKRNGTPLQTQAENMNEPVPSLYESLGVSAPLPLTTSEGTPVALFASDVEPTSLTLIITDLHELRMDDGALLNALNERCLALGRTIGIAAITSEFAGYIPGIGPNNTTFAWGDPPSGTLDYLLDFTEYKVGISIDPEQRKTATRPFYVLCIGDQGAVDTYLLSLADRLNREFAGHETFVLRTAIFGSGYVPSDYTMEGNMRYIAGQGVTAIPEPSAPAGVNLIELKASNQARYLQWELDYKIHPSDPRGTNLSPSDFTFVAQAVSGATTSVLPDLNWEIIATTEDSVTLSLRLDLPQGILQQGSYTLALIGSLTAPPELPGSDWLDAFGYDADGTALYDMEQNLANFDGSRTLFLSRLIDTLGKANLGRLGVAQLGTVQIALTVYA